MLALFALWRGDRRSHIERPHVAGSLAQMQLCRVMDGWMVCLCSVVGAVNSCMSDNGVNQRAGPIHTHSIVAAAFPFSRATLMSSGGGGGGGRAAFAIHPSLSAATSSPLLHYNCCRPPTISNCSSRHCAPRGSHREHRK